MATSRLPDVAPRDRAWLSLARWALWAVVALLVGAAAARGDVTVVFRYDDFSADAPGERERNQLRRDSWEAEQQVDALFKRYGLSYVIAVIPFRNTVNAAGQPIVVSISDDPEKALFLREGIRQGRIDVAQHGFAHVQHSPDRWPAGECLGRPYQELLGELSRGQAALGAAIGGEPVKVFVPPWNGWDSNAARVVRQLDFGLLSAARFPGGGVPEGLTVVPYTVRLADLEPAVFKQSQLPDDAVIVVLYHPSDLTSGVLGGSDAHGLARLREILAAITASKTVRVRTLSQLMLANSALTTERYVASARLMSMHRFWERILPTAWLPGQSSIDLYLTEEAYRALVRRWWLLTAGVLAATGLVGEAARRLATRRADARSRALVASAGTVLFLLCLASWYELMSRGWPLNALRVLPAALFLPCPVWVGWKLTARRAWGRGSLCGGGLAKVSPLPAPDHIGR